MNSIQTQIFSYMYRYASKWIKRLECRSKLSQRSRFRNLKPSTNTEMEGFLSIIFNMGLITLPQIEGILEDNLDTVGALLRSCNVT